jgi:predicted nucleic acid-binding protein
VSLVVDASVAAKWFVREARHEDAVELLAHPAELHSIDLVAAEVARVAWKKLSRGEIDIAQAHEMVGGVRMALPLLYPTAPFAEHAFDLALRLRHAVYDCLYLACAEAVEGIVITDDREFCKKASEAGFGERVVALGSRPISAMISR